MKDTYDACPICGKFLEIRGGESGNALVSFCSNETEIIFAKAGKTEIPEYHYFSYSRDLKGTFQWTIQFHLSPSKIIRVTLRPGNPTSVGGRYGRVLLRVPQLLEPDFPALTKLKNKIKTYLTFQ
jgi:hypothetical protein